MPMHRLLCCESKGGLVSDAIAREGAKAKAKGGDDRTTTAAEATVTNESLMFCCADFESYALENERRPIKSTLQHVCGSSSAADSVVGIGF